MSPSATPAPGQRFKYQRIARELAHEIRSDFAPGQRFHSEPDLVQRLEVTRDTVRRAIDVLAMDGLLERRGRAGTFVAAAAADRSHDDRLICFAAPVRSHVWDRLSVALAAAASVRGRLLLTCDTGQPCDAPGVSALLPDAELHARLAPALSLRPGTLVIPNARGYGCINALRQQFRRLVILNWTGVTGFDHVAQVYPLVFASWQLAARDARATGFERLILLPAYLGDSVADLQNRIRLDAVGAYPLADQTLVLEHLPDWRDHLVANLRDDPRPAAIISSFDWGAHCVLETLEAAAIAVPDQAAVYGMGNTPWSAIDHISSVYPDPDQWAETVIDAVDHLETGLPFVDSAIGPSLIRRASTRPLPI